MKADFFPGEHSWHSPRHWKRVAAFGAWLCRQHQEADAEVVRLFSLFHDCQRLTEGSDPEHGARAAARARAWCGTMFQLEANRLELLCEACEGHDQGRTSTHPTVGACWDADRLDLDRVAIHPRAAFMSTAAGRRLAELSPPKRCREAGLELW